MKILEGRDLHLIKLALAITVVSFDRFRNHRLESEQADLIALLDALVDSDEELEKYIEMARARTAEH